MNNTWYHGTTAEATRNILEIGEFRVQDEEGSAFYVSRPGRLYISRDIGVAIQHGQSRVEHGFDDAFGIIEMKLKDPSKAVPDELELGYSIMLYYRDRKLESQYKDPDDYGMIDDPEYPSAWSDESHYLYEAIWELMPQDLRDYVASLSLDDLLDQEVAANLGDDLIDYLRENDPGALDTMRKNLWFNNYTTTPDNIEITETWIGTLRDFQRPMTNISFDTEELDPHKVYRDMRVRGIGRGWHNEPYRHSLASRGVRTR